MDNTSLQRVRELLDTGKSFGIAIGAQSGMDEMGAALALYLSLTYANKQVSIVSAVEPTVALSSLVGIDKVKSSFEGGGVSGDLIVSFPYREGEIEKVSYTIDNGYLNIVVKAGERGLAFDERDVLFKRGSSGGGVPDILFIVGTPRLSDLGNLFNPELLRDTRVINIDYRTENQGYGDVVLVAPKFSSVSEQIADLLSGLNLEIDVDVAQNLFDGIAYATENFQSPRTSSLAFEISGLLMRKGAVRIQQPVRPQPSMATQMPSMPQPQAPQMPQRPPVTQQPSYRQQPPMPPMPQPQAPQMPQPPRPQQGFGEAPYGAQQYQQPPVQQPSFRQQPPATQQAPQMPPMPQQQQPAPQSQNQQQDDAPSDWLTPKVYKGSTAV